MQQRSWDVIDEDTIFVRENELDSTKNRLTSTCFVAQSNKSFSEKKRAIGISSFRERSFCNLFAVWLLNQSEMLAMLTEAGFKDVKVQNVSKSGAESKESLLFVATMGQHNILTITDFQTRFFDSVT